MISWQPLTLLTISFLKLLSFGSRYSELLWFPSFTKCSFLIVHISSCSFSSTYRYDPGSSFQKLFSSLSLQLFYLLSWFKLFLIREPPHNHLFISDYLLNADLTFLVALQTSYKHFMHSTPKEELLVSCPEASPSDPSNNPGFQE